MRKPKTYIPVKKGFPVVKAKGKNIRFVGKLMKDV